MSFQVSCTYGRDDFESWGRRRKRREVQLPANVIDNEVDTQMRLSHEIIVLDFGDEKTSPFEFDATAAHNHNGKRLAAAAANFHADCICLFACTSSGPSPTPNATYITT